MACILCPLQATHGHPGANPVYCQGHSLVNMIQLVIPVPIVLCSNDMCNLQASFGFQGNPPRLCATHKLPNMVHR